VGQSRGASTQELDRVPDLQPPQGDPFIAHQLVVGLRRDAPRDLAAQQGAEVIERVPRLDAELWRVGTEVRAAQRALEGHPHVEYAEPNYLMRPAQTPDDPRFGDQWALQQSSDHDIDAPEAWDEATGTDVVVAVIDSGIDYTHPDLDDNMWTNPGEVPGNGMDDDGNGYVDDVHGWDFREGEGEPLDPNGHGTHIAGTIAAEGNNGTGVSGIAWSARLMAVKTSGSDGYSSYLNVARGITYAADHGARVVNISWGGGAESYTLGNAIDHARSAGVLIVAAAGNQGRNTDEEPFYPASFEDANVLSVAATGSNDGKPGWSNYGATTVDLGAPGRGILNTTPGGGYGNNSGTSMATPHAAGAATLLWSHDPSRTFEEVKAAILGAVDPVSSMDGRTVTGGRLNIGNLFGSCGNGTVDPGEECDEGGPSATCDADCTPARCGDGLVNTAAGEECDGGGETASCDADCTLAMCGDGVVNTAAGEECDGGGETASCDADCTLAMCGDGVVNTAAGEQCDDGGESAECDSDCTPAMCGDGVVNGSAGEQCDGGGETESCNADCTLASCGDGVVNEALGEECDDGGESASCDDDCTPAMCGDGRVNAAAGEECDGGGETASCDEDCTMAMCGDGVVNTAAGEECDGGGETASCDEDCTMAVCGDGVVNTTADEQCDDGNRDPGDGCSPGCLREEPDPDPGSDPGMTPDGGTDSDGSAPAPDGGDPVDGEPERGVPNGTDAGASGRAVHGGGAAPPRTLEGSSCALAPAGHRPSPPLWPGVLLALVLFRQARRRARGG
jgi:cysteine-rich repeat protein